jgi:hypothetical protein
METHSIADSLAALKEVKRDFDEIQNISFINFFNDESMLFCKSRKWKRVKNKLSNLEN